jgi:hypothetical protein
MGINAQGNTEGAGKSEVGELKISLFINEKILRLQIAMEDSVRVAPQHAYNQTRSFGRYYQKRAGK